MSHGWSDSDKQVAQKAAIRARSAAEEEALRFFRDYSVKTADDLWQLELKIREWRRDRQYFTLNYARAEEQVADWIARGWLRSSDVDAFSPTRLERIRLSTGYTR
jgi:hypothetical protein